MRLFVLLFGLLGACLCCTNLPVLAQRAYVKSSNPGDFDQFGDAVAVSADGSTMAVGAFAEDSSASGVNGNQTDDGTSTSGAVYVFVWDGASWSQQAYIKANVSGLNDRFGRSVSLSSDGNSLAVGAIGEDSSATGVNGNQTDNSMPSSGAVYVFSRSGGIWSQQTYLKASNTDANDRFGWSVSLSSDGNSLAVGAIGEDSMDGSQADNGQFDPNSGAVYVFVRNAGWTQHAYLKARNIFNGALLGYSVSLSGDGSTLAAGATGEGNVAIGINGNENDGTVGSSRGAVYVFVRNAGNWTQQAYVKASNTGWGDSFGKAVSVASDGNTLAVGAHSERSSAVGINGIQASDSLTDAGAGYVFVRVGETWAQQSYVKASNTNAFDKFGSSVSLSSDGSVIVFGASGESSAATGVNGNQFDNGMSHAGAVYVFSRVQRCVAFGKSQSKSSIAYSSFVKAVTPVTNDGFGTPAVLSSDGNTMAIGGRETVHIFDKDGAGRWIQQAELKAGSSQIGDEFGTAISLSSDGTVVAIGAWLEDSSSTGINGDETDDGKLNSGAAYVFVRSGASWSQQAYFKANTTNPGDQFGRSVALSGDGNSLAVGAWQDRSNATGIDGDETDSSLDSAGAVFVFVKNGATWSREAYIKASNTDARDRFGQSVSLSNDGNTLAVGAYGERSNAGGINGDQTDNSQIIAGAVYVFVRDTGAWSQEAYVKASNARSGSQFGWSVSLSSDGNTLAVGAFGESSDATGVNGNQIDRSMLNSGAAYVFARSAGTWAQEAYIKASNTDSDDYFGRSVWLSSDGTTLAVGAPQESSNSVGINANEADNSISWSGAVYVFAKDAGTWSQREYVKATNTDANDRFGESVSLDGSGDNVVVGASGESSNGNPTDNSASASGAAYVVRLAPARVSSQPGISNSPLENTAVAADDPAGRIGGIVLMALAPVIAGAVGILALWVAKRKSLRKKMDVTAPDKKSAAFIVVTVLVLVISIGGVALTAYAVYDFYNFFTQTLRDDRVYGSVIERFENVSSYSLLDCFISDSEVFDGTRACDCAVGSDGLWQCVTQNLVSSTQDCSISSSPFCTCSFVSRANPPRPFWTCEKLPFDLSVNVSAQQDFGLRFLPPNFGNELNSVNYFASVPKGEAGNSTYALLFSEPVADTLPITVVLGVSLGFDILGLILLLVETIIGYLQRKKKISKNVGKVRCGSKKVRIFAMLDVISLGIGLALFGAVLFVGFTFAVINVPEAKLQKIDMKSRANELSANYYDRSSSSSRSWVPSEFCKCPREYQQRGCFVQQRKIVFPQSVVLNETRVVFECDVVVMGGLTVSAETVFENNVELHNGDLVFNAAALIAGSVAVHNGGVSGTTWSAEGPTIGGSLTALDGVFKIDAAASVASLERVQETIRVRRFEFGATLTEIRFGTKLRTAQPNVVLHTSETLSLPSFISLTIYGGVPSSSWQDVPITLAKSDAGVSLSTSETFATFSWDYIEELVRVGTCGTMTPQRVRVENQQAVIQVAFGCHGSPPPMFGYAYQPTVGTLSFSSQEPQSYKLQSVPENLTLTFGFNHQNCGNQISYKREKNWIETLKVAGFNNTQLFSICPLEKITFDDANYCVSYECNGNFKLPDRFGVKQTNAIQDNIRKGIIFDAAGTGGNLVGTVLELIVLPTT